MSEGTEHNGIDVEYVANLAKIELTENEIEKFQSQLNQIVGYVEKIRELDLDGVEPSTRMRSLNNVYRKDEVRPSLAHEKAMANAPEELNGLFKVPKIME
jgi:aspartyl-tRNA(Asn)/glutamyl-tRNA(Gln) amidotransferase subunit C